MNFDTKWSGEEKLIISMDCGTTQTGVSYAHLLPQGFPIPKRVTEWPGQGGQTGEAKIPTIVWYDVFGRAQAFGAEASAIDPMEAEEKGWQLAQHFKLHLHPEIMKARNPISLDPLPLGTTIKQIYSDFFRYVFTQTQKFFAEREYQGNTIWWNLRKKKKIEFVIAHPNGWTLHEQAFLREAAVNGGLVSIGDASRTIHMITEGEASVHFVMPRLHGNHLQAGVQFLICDAGGSTVDSTLYNVTAISPHLELAETRASACIQAGGLFVNKEAEDFFAKEFYSVGYGKADVELATEAFEEEKKKFDDPCQDTMKLRVGMTKMNIPSINVKRGVLTLQGAKVARFFSRPIKQIVASINEQMNGHSVKNLILVGGFGDSRYLRRELKKEFRQRVTVMLANESTTKAVADGAIAWYIQKAVKARRTRFSYGTSVKRPYDSTDWRHNDRHVYEDLDGDYIYGVWNEVVAKDCAFATGESQRARHYRIYASPKPFLGSFTIQLFVHAGSGTVPYFIKDKAGNVTNDFTSVCEIVADLSNVTEKLDRRVGSRGVYYVLSFEVGILFGSTELSAILIWKDSKGHECRSNAAVIPQQFS